MVVVVDSDIAIIKNNIQYIIRDIKEIKKMINGNGRAGLIERTECLETKFSEHIETLKGNKQWIIWIPTVITMMIGLMIFAKDYLIG